MTVEILGEERTEKSSRLAGAVPVIYIAMNGFGPYRDEGLSGELEYAHLLMEQADVKEFAFPRDINSLDWALASTSSQLFKAKKRLIVAHKTLWCGVNRRPIDITDKLRGSLDENTTLVYLSNNGDGNEFYNSVSPMLRGKVAIVPKRSSALSIDNFKNYLYAAS